MSTPVELQVKPLFEPDATLWRPDSNDAAIPVRSRLRTAETREAAAAVADFISTIDQRVTSNQNAVCGEVDHATHMIEVAYKTIET